MTNITYQPEITVEIYPWHTSIIQSIYHNHFLSMILILNQQYSKSFNLDFFIRKIKLISILILRKQITLKIKYSRISHNSHRN
ncbi:unnamed protein product [Paramecium octaurelia]|uniref:Uncharacterized protein n=1 Tax=Paramecium octaurelia TaxID=43137 RepID=A0A8S1V441_PAROT|nr:unnamed protein product [Paramecium octaurelia]